MTSSWRPQPHQPSEARACEMCGEIHYVRADPVPSAPPPKFCSVACRNRWNSRHGPWSYPVAKAAGQVKGP